MRSAAVAAGTAGAGGTGAGGWAWGALAGGRRAGGWRAGGWLGRGRGGLRPRTGRWRGARLSLLCPPLLCLPVLPVLCISVLRRRISVALLVWLRLLGDNRRMNVAR